MLIRSSQSRRQHSRSFADQSEAFWPRWPYIVMLCVLFFGPLVAPLFQATGLPLVSDSGALARDLLARYVCPTPAKSYMLAAFPMAVCARCWGATVGLWVAYLSIRKRQIEYRKETTRTTRFATSYFLLPVPLRFMLSGLPFLLWWAEIVWWPAAPLWVLLVNGALAGCAAGLFFCSVWPGMMRRT